MKITKSQLKRIIKEEMEAVLHEGFVEHTEDDYVRVKEALRKDKELWRIGQSWGERAEAIIAGLEHPEGHRYKCWGGLSQVVETRHSHGNYGRADVGVTWAAVEAEDEQ